MNDWQKRVDQLKATIEGMPADKWTVLALADVAAGVLVASTGNPTDAKELFNRRLALLKTEWTPMGSFSPQLH